MRSKWKAIKFPKFCYRSNFLSCFDAYNNKASSTSDIIGLKKKARVQEEDGVLKINVGSCKKFRIFKALEGFTIEAWNGSDFNSVLISEQMFGSYAGSFIFTKRFTREIHKSHVQKRQKRAFNKTKKK